MDTRDGFLVEMKRKRFQKYDIGLNSDIAMTNDVNGGYLVNGDQSGGVQASVSTESER